MSRGLVLTTGGTDNHLMVIDLRPTGLRGRAVQSAFDEVGVTVNANAFPGHGGSPFNPNGIRLGSPSVTSRGMGEAEMDEIAALVAPHAHRVRRPRRSRRCPRAQPGAVPAIPTPISGRAAGVIAADSPWLTALPPFLVASAVCIAAVPGSMWLARRTGAVAEPDGDRHLHRQADAEARGASRCSPASRWRSRSSGRASPIAGRSSRSPAAITVAMAIDDILDLSWRSKLGIEVGVGVLAVLFGITITTIAIPGAHSPSVIDLVWLSAPVTVVWLVGMQVSVNLLDGADGVAAGVIAIVAAVCLLAAISRIGAPDHRDPGADRGRDPERGGDGLLPWIPRLQPAARPRVHGRFRQPFPRRRPRR